MKSPSKNKPSRYEYSHMGDVAWCECECHTRGSEWSDKNICKKCYELENKPSIDVGGDNISDKGGKRGMEQVLHRSPSTARVSPRQLIDISEDWEHNLNETYPGLKFLDTPTRVKIVDFIRQEKQKSFEEGRKSMLDETLKGIISLLK